MAFYHRLRGQTVGLILDTLENSEYDQEIPQSKTADNPVAPRGRAAQPPRGCAYLQTLSYHGSQ